MGAKRGMRAKKPQVYPQRYIEDIFAKHDEVAAPDRVPQQQKLLRPVLYKPTAAARGLFVIAASSGDKK